MNVFGYLIPILIIGVYIATLHRFVRENIHPFAYRLLVVLTLFELVLVLIHLLVFWTPGLESLQIPLNVSAERTVGAIFSGTQLFLVGVIAFLIARWGVFTANWKKEFWYFLGLLFIFLCADEFYRIHDYVSEVGFAGAAAVGLIILLTGLWLGFRNEKWLLILFVAGVFVMGTAIALDIPLPNTPETDALEEFLEMNGVTLVLVALLHFAQSRLASAHWQKTRRVLLPVGLICASWLVASFWTITNIAQGALIVAIVAVLIYIIILRWLLEDYLSKGSRNLLILLTLIAGIFVWLHLAESSPPLFDLQAQDSIRQIIMILQFGIVSILAIWGAIRSQTKVFWAFVVIVFLLLTISEIFSLKEQIRTIIYIAIVGGGFGIVAIWLRLQYQNEVYLNRLMTIGIILYGLFLILNTILPTTSERFAFTGFIEIHSMAFVIIGLLALLQKRSTEYE